MKLFTSSFAACGLHPRAVAISRGVPQFFRGRTFPKLAPSWAMLADTKKTAKLLGGEAARLAFNEAYTRQLGKLDPNAVAAELGSEAVLLCWEQDVSCCHRSTVAAWLRAAGHEVLEISCHDPISLGASRPARRAEQQRELWSSRNEAAT